MRNNIKRSLDNWQSIFMPARDDAIILHNLSNKIMFSLSRRKAGDRLREFSCITSHWQLTHAILPFRFAYQQTHIAGQLSSRRYAIVKTREIKTITNFSCLFLYLHWSNGWVFLVIGTYFIGASYIQLHPTTEENTSLAAVCGRSLAEFKRLASIFVLISVTINYQNNME